MTQDKEIVSVHIVSAHTSLLSHYAINTYWLLCMRKEKENQALPWKWKAKKKS